MLDTTRLRAGLLNACARVLDARAELTALDAAAGDGDLGESLAIGFAAVEKELAGDEAGDAGALLLRAGGALSRAAPSTFGTLLGMAWRDAGRALAGRTELAAADVVGALDVMAAGVARRGGVHAGQRTVLDGLLASRDRAGAAGDDPIAALRAAADGARAGAEATASMRPQVGRAGWIGERAQGRPDAGASAWAVIAGAIAAGAERD
ncbi:DAK2 domain-containing protein [Phytohabitans flavus]|uniref:DAK2 domain-containing protein n=1 Tax=Phytohabitans flavus TaxID=1076124 RepID=UPI001564C41B|nr:DAK2 domain-containing protein [Phytohabitans flavus]